MKRAFFLTGRPGIGKTTVLLRIVEELKKRDLKIGGLISQEIRRAGTRVGFKIIDLDSGREGWLAHVRQPVGPKVGKYRVCMKDLESIGVDAILRALREADIVVIDEIGPMELFSQLFKKAVVEALNSGKMILGTIHYRIKTSFIAEIKEREDVAIIEVTRENREDLPEDITREILRLHKKRVEE
ncbi:hypothetical protein DRO38_01030 [Candidatus Bathyarchaeota archaeon]|nr:MAG: hypothetical protein DRO38_01030 [Candidatus Bathyarchaeota archaeon]